MNRHLKPGPEFELSEGLEVQAKRSTKLGQWERAIVVEAGPGDLPILRFRDGTLHAVKPSRIRSKDPRPDVLRPLSKREYAAAPVPSREAIRGALEQGARELRAALEQRPRRTFTPGGTPRPKRAPLRSPEYLAFVRGQPCCVCGAKGPSDPHHFGPRGMGQKTDDFRTVPLCRAHHDHFHAFGVLAGHSRVETECRFYRTQVALLLEYRREHAA